MALTVENNVSLALVSAEQQMSLDSLSHNLRKIGYRVKLFHTQVTTLDLDQLNNFDAIIAFPTTETLAIFSMVIKKSARPLLILLQDPFQAPLPVVIDTSDIVLPYLEQQIEHQVQSILKLRTSSSERLESLEQEIKAQRRINSEIEVLKNAIVRNVSHELRTPLLQVKTGIALIGDALKTNTMPSMTVFTLAQDATAVLESSIKHITMLGSSLEYNPCPIILKDTIEYAKRNLNRAWQRKNDASRVMVEIEPNLPPIYADRQGLSTALQLLIDNALKFSKENVVVSAHRESNRVLISVKDTGIGIPEHILGSIFNLFFQGDSSITRAYGGMGIGLTLVKLILDNHNTEIRVNSKSDEGSTFSFYIDIADLNG